MANLIDKWIAMQAVQRIDSVATLRDGDLVIRMSAVEHVLENLPEAPDINVGNMDTTTHDSIPAKTGGNDEDRTSGDCISRQMTIVTIEQHGTAVLEGRKWDEGIEYGYAAAHRHLVDIIEQLPSVQPEKRMEERTETHGVCLDAISRQQAIDKFIDALGEIFSDIRERHVDDSVCGLCEYDGAYMGQSGEWCNECPGFEKDDCFKLSGKIRKEWTDEIIKALPSAQPEREKGEWVYNSPVTMKCNRCGLVIKDWDWHRFKICPNCGADMRGEENGQK